MKKILMVVLSNWAMSLHAQAPSALTQVDSAVKGITSYVRYIDSLAEYDNRQTLVLQSVEEGPMSLISTTFNPQTNQTDTIDGIKHGGFSKYTTQNITGDTLYRIRYHTNIDKNFYEQYYFRHHQLVYAKIFYEDDETQSRFYDREAYYGNNKLLLVNESKNPIDGFYRQRVNFDALQRAKEYLAEFLRQKR